MTPNLWTEKKPYDQTRKIKWIRLFRVPPNLLRGMEHLRSSEDERYKFPSPMTFGQEYFEGSRAEETKLIKPTQTTFNGISKDWNPKIFLCFSIQYWRALQIFTPYSSICEWNDKNEQLNLLHTLILILLMPILQMELTISLTFEADFPS